MFKSTILNWRTHASLCLPISVLVLGVQPFFSPWRILSLSLLVSLRTPSSTSLLLPSQKDSSSSSGSTLIQAWLLKKRLTKLLRRMFLCSWSPPFHKYLCFYPSESTCVLIKTKEAFTTASQFILRNHCLICLIWSHFKVLFNTLLNIIGDKECVVQI